MVTSLNRLTQKQQKYIETIDELSRERGMVRTTDLAERLEIRPASVSEAVSRLVDRGIAERKSWHEIVLTCRGRAVAKELERRHGTLRRFMVEFLQMSEREADENACRAEHCISPQFVERLTMFADFLEDELAPETRSDWRHRG